MNTKPQLLLDQISISFSVLCTLHCLLMPLILVLFPNLLMGLEVHTFHLILVWLILPSSVLAGTLGCSKHKDINVMLGIAVGLSLLVLTAVWGHEYFGELGEKLVTTAATVLLALSHWRNFLLCKENACKHCESN